MSDYTGPGVYELTAMHAPTRRVHVYGGGSVSGTAVKLWTASAQENCRWEIVAAGGTNGSPESGDRQYHIIGVESGLMLCAAENGSDAGCTISTRNVKDGSCRWKMTPTGDGSYYFASVLNTEKRLCVGQIQDADGAVVMTYQKQDAAHFKFKVTRPAS